MLHFSQATISRIMHRPNALTLQKKKKKKQRKKEKAKCRNDINGSNGASHASRGSHVVKVHAYLRSISFALSLSLRLSLPLSLFIPLSWKYSVNTQRTQTGKRNLSLSLFLTERQPRSTTGSCTKKRGDRGN